MEQQILTRKELYNLVWTVPLLSLSKKYNISDVGLKKLCVRLNIPLPKIGHWQKKQFGKKIVRQSLPADNDVDQEVTLTLRDENSSHLRGELSPLKILQGQIEKSIPLLLKVPETLTNPDKLVVATRNQLLGQKPDSWNYIGMVESGSPELNTRVSVQNVPRALRFWDILIKALQARGHNIHVKYSHTYANVENYDFKILLREKSTKDIYKDGSFNRTRYQPTGVFSLQLINYPSKEWKDGTMLLEDQLSKIIAYLELAGAKEKEDRLHHQKMELERKEQERIREDFRKRQKEDLSAFAETLLKASRWHEANNLRNYINEVEAHAQTHNCMNEELTTWLEWARKKADWYDPFIESEDNLMNGIDRNFLEAPVKQNAYLYGNLADTDRYMNYQRNHADQYYRKRNFW